jgi:hypothetical protein
VAHASASSGELQFAVRIRGLKPAAWSFYIFERFLKSPQGEKK